MPAYFGQQIKSIVELFVCPFDTSQIFAGKAFLNSKTPLFEVAAEYSCRRQNTLAYFGPQRKTIVVLIVCPFDINQIYAGKALFEWQDPTF
jgi:hypothetical protein